MKIIGEVLAILNEDLVVARARDGHEKDFKIGVSVRVYEVVPSSSQIVPMQLEIPKAKATVDAGQTTPGIFLLRITPDTTTRITKKQGSLLWPLADETVEEVPTGRKASVDKTMSLNLVPGPIRAGDLVGVD